MEDVSYTRCCQKDEINWNWKDKPANIKMPYHAAKHFKITAFCDTVASGRLVPEVL